MALRRVVVCDYCEDVNRPTTHYRVTHDGTWWELELCSEHGEAIEKIARFGTERKRPLRFEDTITTMEELEQRKAADAKNSPPTSV